ncbi:MAG: hypothetical protein AB7W47_13690 [Calditrichaceae bacterium]
MPNCGQLTWKAKDVQSLNRPHDNEELWNFAKGWIRRFSETDESNVSEKLIYLWVTVNAWASKSVPDLSRNHEDAYLVHCMAKDKALSERFDKLNQVETEFRDTVKSFMNLAPVFQALWLNNNGIGPWNIVDDRKTYVKKVIKRDPFIILLREDGEKRFPVFAPACALDHLQAGEPIPADWPHLISMIYQVRCNLFHGGKNYNRDSDRKFIELAYKILWEVWKDELPPNVLPNKLPWVRVLIRSGFMIQSADDRNISLGEEIDQNVEYLKEIVNYGRFGTVEDKMFTPADNHIEESVWLNAVASCHGGAEGGTADELPIMDPFMAGLIRWLNLVGIQTTFSCDGHGRIPAQMECVDVNSAHKAACILNFSGRQFRQQGRRVFIVPGQEYYSRGNSNSNVRHLLDVAEWLYSNQSQLSSTVQLLGNISPLLASRSDPVNHHRRHENRRGR